MEQCLDKSTSEENKNLESYSYLEDRLGYKDINTQIFAAMEIEIKSSFGEVTIYFWPDNITHFYLLQCTVISMPRLFLTTYK